MAKIHREFDKHGNPADEYNDAIGHGGLKDSFEEFGDTWKKTRKKLMEEIKTLAEATKTAAQQYEEIDKELAKALRDAKSKGRRSEPAHGLVAAAGRRPDPGDPYEVAELGAQLRSMADMIEEQSRNIEALSSVEGWDSDAGRAFNEVADGAAGRLKKAFERYDEAAKAIGTKVREGGGESKEYASELHRAQEKADKALTKYRTAHGDYEDAQREIDKLLKKVDNKPADFTDDELTEYRRWVKKKETASKDMGDAARDVRDARGIFDDAGDRAAKHIKNVVHHDGVHDPGGFWNTLADWADAFSNISAILGVLAVICAFVPPLQFLAPIFATLSVISSALALAGHIYDMTARGGKFDLMKLGTDILGIMPGLGVLKGFKAFKGMANLGRMARLGGRGLNALDGIGHSFFNGIGVKVTKSVISFGAKKLGKDIAPGRSRGTASTSPASSRAPDWPMSSTSSPPVGITARSPRSIPRPHPVPVAPALAEAVPRGSRRLIARSGATAMDDAPGRGDRRLTARRRSEVTDLAPAL
ncbi:putative T7SS-secreted protein [Streptomyces sp. M19]